MTPDLAALLGVPHRNDVSVVVVGGIAVGVHGPARMTLDVDVVPDPDRGNIVAHVTWPTSPSCRTSDRPRGAGSSVLSRCST